MMRIDSNSRSAALSVAMITAMCVLYVNISRAAPTKPPARASAPAAASAVPPPAVPCQACHGPQGEGMVAGERPAIAGQTAWYLDKQLRDFASGARENPIMGAIAKMLSSADHAQVVEYYASLPVPVPPPGSAPTDVQYARGHQLAIEGAEARHVQACNNCHGPGGAGVAFSAPRLEGQLASYMVTQLKAWRQGDRKNDAGSLMSSVAKGLDDTDIAAVTSYYASLGQSRSE
jgi:cytochrome c553